MSVSPGRSQEVQELARRMSRSPAGESDLLETPTLSEPHVAREEGGAAQILQLQQELQQKEQLVVALTDRLEQAAEQLDRVRRTGGDRALRRSPGGGMPPELIEEQRSTIEDLKQTLARWEEMQAGMTLGRLETQVSELRDLIVGRLPVEESRSSPSPRSTGRTEERAAATSWWEQQKAALLGDAPPPEPVETHTPAEPTERVSLSSIEIPDAPAALNYENLVVDEARAALQERDAIITKLREQLLLAQSAETFAGHDLNSAELPEGLQERLGLLEQQWQAKFRQVELDLSIERARLSREEAQIHSQRELIDKEMVRLGLHGRDVRSDHRLETESSPRRRWYNFLQHDTSED